MRLNLLTKLSQKMCKYEQMREGSESVRKWILMELVTSELSRVVMVRCIRMHLHFLWEMESKSTLPHMQPGLLTFVFFIFLGLTPSSSVPGLEEETSNLPFLWLLKFEDWKEILELCSFRIAPLTHVCPHQCEWCSVDLVICPFAWLKEKHTNCMNVAWN